MKATTLRLSGRPSQRFFAPLTALALAASLVGGCASGAATDTQSPEGTAATDNMNAVAISTDTSATTIAEAMEANHAYWSVDREVEAAQENVPITLNGTTVAADSTTGITVDGSTLTVTEAGTYTLSGTWEGQVVVDAGDEAQVTLVLSGVGIANEAGPAVWLKSADGVRLELAAGTTNALSDADSYAEDAEADAALFSQVDLQIDGEGTLSVTGNGADAIASKDDLVITGGTVNAFAADDGIRGKDALVVTGGTVNVVSTQDGLKTTNEDEADRGYVLIADGTVSIEAGEDGIDAITDVLIGGGSVTITQSEEGIEGALILIEDGTVDITSTDDGLNATMGSTTTDEAQSSTPETTTDVTTDVAADAQDSSPEASSTQDPSGQGSATTATTPGSETQMGAQTTPEGTGGMGGGRGARPTPPEGGGPSAEGTMPEGMTPPTDGTMPSPPNGGQAPADGTLADGTMPTPPETGTLPEGTTAEGTMPGGGAGDIDDGSALLISGGTVTVNAEGDGIDSNGSLTISGGDVTVFGTTRGGNGAFDANGVFTVTGGTILALSAGQMEQAPSSLTQGMIEATVNGGAGHEVTVKDASGSQLSAVTAPKAFGYVFFSAPEVTDGETVTVTVDGTATEVVAGTQASMTGRGPMGGGQGQTGQGSSSGTVQEEQGISGEGSTGEA